MITDTLQYELRERYNPNGSTLRRQQLRMFEMLQYIDTVCKNHGIRYWLCSGTLLGAVRHGGFIPWDDDVDIEMLREDYRKFVKVMATEALCGNMFCKIMIRILTILHLMVSYGIFILI